ncbi:chorismate synthase [Kyrpidia spormannii]|uniref:Chorismate synthase n=2 Tax=Kyrpidia spormannii TaxID=2055160 RepID=A0ACA8Z8Y9_9BACL|nr:chorismate synthase [Kyrpidia spormannii]CAB3392070.1 chorismate synthase [Kyrpidia spormannii]CAB3392990.1 chorismate synthase [Kyrpidia spormannii]
MLRFLTAGESHGPELTAIVEGLPSRLPIRSALIDEQLRRRQQGHGRGGRMRIESDRVEITSGLRFGLTLGTPLTMRIRNRDWENWKTKMAVEGDPPPEAKPVTKPRPGHADLAGVLKYNHDDVRNVLERSSARNTATLVAVGSVARQLLAPFGIRIFSHVVEIGGVEAKKFPKTLEQIPDAAESSTVRCADPEAAEKMVEAIDQARREGNTLGGVFEVVALGVPPGLGSYAHPDRRLDGRLAGALMSIQAIKGVEVGLGFTAARLPGSEVHDEIGYDPEKGYTRDTNHAGGIEGGVSNGQPVVVRAAMKPIPTLYKPLRSVDIHSKELFQASVERSDTCAVPAAAVVGEAMVAWVLAFCFREKFSGDSFEEVEAQYRAYMEMVSRR